MSASKVAVEGAGQVVYPALHRNGHAVQFYAKLDSLLEPTARFLGESLAAGDAAIAIATSEHLKGLARQFEKGGFQLSKASDDGRYIALDAAEMLPQFMIGDMPDRRTFERVIGAVITKAQAAVGGGRLPCVVIFGEMVALLWAKGNRGAAIRLEELWNELGKKFAFSLRCGYPMSSFGNDERGELFLKVCDQHSKVVPELDASVSLSDDEGLRTIAKLQQKVQALEHQKALHESEERFRLLIEAVEDYAIFMLDAYGHVSSWNSGAERIKGYRATEILGKHFSCFFPEEDIRSGKPERELEKARDEGRALDDGWRVRKDGSKFWANVVLTALKDHSGKVVGFAKVTRDFTEQMQAQRLLEESRRRLQESERSLRRLSVRLLRSQDEERRRIARDLHDSLGQYLSVLKMKLDFLTTARTSVGKDAQRKELEQCAQLTEEAVKEVRTMSYLLYPPMLEELGLKSAIPWYVDGFAKRSGIKTSFEVSPDFGRLPGDIELVLFRVLQESLTNVHRHSGSATAEVRLVLDNGNVVLRVGDNGKGIPTANIDEMGQDGVGSAGVGLRGMSERVRQVGGKFEASSNGRGTAVTATIPVHGNPVA